MNKASCRFVKNPDMLKKIMPAGEEIKSRKMGSKIFCVILHEASSKCNASTIPIQFYLLKMLLALQSFASHHLCQSLESLFSKLQTACLKAYQPPSHKLPSSATLMIWYFMVDALQYYWIQLIKQLHNINWLKSLTHSVLHWASNISNVH